MYAYIVSPTNKGRLVTKKLEHTSDVGVVKLILTDGDLQNVKQGLYHMHIVKNDQNDQTYLPLYSDQQGNARIEIEVTDLNGRVIYHENANYLEPGTKRRAVEIEVTDQVVQDPVATQEDLTFLQTADTDTGANANVYVSNAMYGNLEKNFQNCQHTVAVYPTSAYTGQVTVQASLISGVPDSDDTSNDWFDVKHIDMTANTQIRTSTFTVSANWIRVVSKPTVSDTTANLTKVLLRN